MRTNGQRHGKAINHNIGPASQRTHCRAVDRSVRLIDRLTRLDPSPPPAAIQRRSTPADQGVILSDNAGYSAAMHPPTTPADV